jgi:hypothetical protein
MQFHAQLLKLFNREAARLLHPLGGPLDRYQADWINLHRYSLFQ